MLTLLDCWVEKCEEDATVEVISPFDSFVILSTFQGPPNGTLTPKLQRYEAKGGEDDQHVLSLLPLPTKVQCASALAEIHLLPRCSMSKFNKESIDVYIGNIPH